MKATVLTDNIKNGSLKGEWGLSVYIEYGEKKILLDAGASGLFYKNAESLGLSIPDVDFAVLSHAHYDHSDGMLKFFEINSKAKLYLRESCKENCYGKKLIFSKYIGIKKGLLEKYKGRLEFVGDKTELYPGVYLLGHTTPNLEAIGKREGMYQKIEKKWQTDDFSHEQSLVFRTDKGLVIFNSCCHGGADNIIKEVAKAFEGENIYAMIGGFHLFNKSAEIVEAFAKRVNETGIKKVYTGHCTGDKAYKILKKELGESLNQLKVGLVMEF